MQHTLNMRGPMVSLEPLTIDHAKNWAALGDLDAYWRHQPEREPLMLTHAFDTWACERVALRCDAGHDGTLADTTYFSIIREEWPGVRRSLLSRVEPGE